MVGWLRRSDPRAGVFPAQTFWAWERKKRQIRFRSFFAGLPVGYRRLSQSEQGIPLVGVLHSLAQHHLLEVGEVLQVRNGDDDCIYFILKSICGATGTCGVGHSQSLCLQGVEEPRDNVAFDGQLASGRFETCKQSGEFIPSRRRCCIHRPPAHSKGFALYL